MLIVKWNRGTRLHEIENRMRHKEKSMNKTQTWCRDELLECLSPSGCRSKARVSCSLRLEHCVFTAERFWVCSHPLRSQRWLFSFVLFFRNCPEVFFHSLLLGATDGSLHLRHVAGLFMWNWKMCDGAGKCLSDPERSVNNQQQPCCLGSSAQISWWLIKDDVAQAS